MANQTGLLRASGAHRILFHNSDTGRFVTHPIPEFIMSESLFSLAEEFAILRFVTLVWPWLQEESGFTEIGPALGGGDAFLAYARIASPGWSLGAVFPKKELLAELEQPPSKDRAAGRRWA